MPADYGLFDRHRLASPIFHPRPDWSKAPAGATDHLLDVEPGVALAARYFRSRSPTGTILYFHGNGEVVGDYDEVAALYHGIGLDLFVVDYRGYGRSGGQPGFAAMMADAHPVADRFLSIVSESGPAGCCFIMGRSLGGLPALSLAAHRHQGFSGLILESASTSMRRLAARFADPLPASVVDELDAAHHATITSISLPTLILHGERDSLIPLRYAEEVRELLTAVEPRLVVVAGACHNDIFSKGMHEYLTSISDFTARQPK